MEKLARVLVAVLAVVGALAVGFGILTIRGGFTARANASGVERRVADALRDLATPRSARSLRSPFAGTPDVLTRGRRHFASECASCHGNDGKGSDFGRRLFPPVPNLRDDTGDLTEGEIFYAIENGIRWSGMPAFADPTDPDDEREHWEVVYFIRHLPDLMPSEIEEMKRYNPRPPSEGEGPAAPVHQHVHGMPPAAGGAEGHSHEVAPPSKAKPAGAGHEHGHEH